MITTRPGRSRGWLPPVLVAALALALAVHPRAQLTSVPPIVERLHAYLDDYESKLGALVAEEVFRQETTYIVDMSLRQVAARRRLVSDVGFLRLPGGLAWLGQRSVRSIDDRPLGNVARLDRAFLEAGPDLFQRARAIAEANARHNLGHPRSLNLPTLPLDLLGRRRAAAFTATLEGEARINGRKTTRLMFRERPPGGIIAYDESRYVRAEVRAWIDDGGAMHRAHVTLRSPAGNGQHHIRVDFTPDRDLGLLLPRRLSESFEGEFTGEGTASYRNYRRFQTAGRLVPPDPGDSAGVSRRNAVQLKVERATWSPPRGVVGSDVGMARIAGPRWRSTQTSAICFPS